MNEKTKTALKELLRAVLAAIVAFVTAVLSVSCGSSTKVVVRDTNQSTSVTITQSTSNESQVNPTVTVDINPKE